MKVVILCGGFGTRLSEYTDTVPKPMVEVGGIPILIHIMRYFSSYGYNDFLLALGYKAEYIKRFFLDYERLNNNFYIDFQSGQIEIRQRSHVSWRVGLFDTGLHSMTGGRVKRLESEIGASSFFLTYGDGVSNVDLNALRRFHEDKKKTLTITGVHPSARFGELVMDDSVVRSFKEKPQVVDGWVNGGFMIAEPQLLNYIEGDSTVLEESPLQTLAEEGEMVCFRHEDFWQCMDTKRDRDLLEKLWADEACPWRR